MNSVPSVRYSLLAVLVNAIIFFSIAVTLFTYAGSSGALVGQVERVVAGPSEKRILRFGKIPNVSPREAYRIYAELMELLNENLSCCTLELVLAPDYPSCVQMLHEQELDLAWLGTVSYVRARDEIPMIPLVSPIWSGRKGYSGVIFTVEGTGVTSLQQLRGKRIAFVDKESASGYVYPLQVLVDAGLNPSVDFARVDFLGTHDAVLMAVMLGEYDAGAVFDNAYDSVADRAHRLKLRILAQTAIIPGEPIVASTHLDPAIVAEVKEAFLALPTEQLAGSRLQDLFGFEPAADDQYTGVKLLENP
jgi:phosphate/phosphite/phosphonate ABC transporter binding protein